MRKEEINKIMNCGCLEDIIENDENKHNITYCHPGNMDIETTQNSLDVQILFETRMSYRNKVNNLKNKRSIIDRIESDSCSIPFLFCPICGSKTKHDIPKESFYHQFQNS